MYVMYVLGKRFKDGGNFLKDRETNQVASEEQVHFLMPSSRSSHRHHHQKYTLFNKLCENANKKLFLRLSIFHFFLPHFSIFLVDHHQQRCILWGSRTWITTTTATPSEHEYYPFSVKKICKVVESLQRWWQHQLCFFCYSALLHIFVLSFFLLLSLLLLLMCSLMHARIIIGWFGGTKNHVLLLLIIIIMVICIHIAYVTATLHKKKLFFQIDRQRERNTNKILCSSSSFVFFKTQLIFLNLSSFLFEYVCIQLGTHLPLFSITYQCQRTFFKRIKKIILFSWHSSCLNWLDNCSMQYSCEVHLVQQF